MKQEPLPGTERETIDEIEQAAEVLRKIRTKRLKIQVEEKEAALALKGVMEKHKAEKYTYEADVDGEEKILDVTVEQKEKVFVRVHKEESDEEDED